MGTAARSTSWSNATFKTKASYAFIVLPILGLGAFFWKVTHTLTKPDISIYRAAERADFDAVRAHVLTGTPVNTLSSDGHSPVYYATLGGDPEIVDYLLKNGALPDAEARGQTTPLYVAAGQGSTRMVKALIAAGATPLSDREKVSPLFAAADSGNPEIVKLFLEMGADPNVQMKTNTKGTPLCNAALKGNVECIQVLLDHGADIKATGFDHRSAIRYAAQSGHYDAVKLLIDKGGDPDVPDGRGVLPISTSFHMPADEKVAWLLLENMKDFKALDWHARSPLHYASEGGSSPKMIKALLAKGMDPNLVDSQGYTPLMLAYERKHYDVEDTLVEGGARLSLRQMIREALDPARDVAARESTRTNGR